MANGTGYAKWLKWITSVLATLTVVFEAGHLGHWFNSETTVMILAILTALAAWVQSVAYVGVNLDGPEVRVDTRKPGEKR